MTTDQKTKAVWNGQWENLEDLKIPVEDRAFYFGDGVYEVVRVYNGKPWLLKKHLARLRASLDSLSIPITELSSVENFARQCISRNQIANGLIYIQISRGTSQRGHTFPKNISPNVLAYAKNFLAEPWEKQRTTGIKCISHDEIRWARRDIKSVNLLANCIAKQKAEDASAHEAIFVEKDGTVTEGSSNNVFVVRNNEILTHPANYSILNGITRQHVIELTRSLSLNLNERTFSIGELLTADEVFLSGTTSEIIHVASVDGQTIGHGSLPVYQKLRDAFTRSL